MGDLTETAATYLSSLLGNDTYVVCVHPIRDDVVWQKNSVWREIADSSAFEYFDRISKERGFEYTNINFWGISKKLWRLMQENVNYEVSDDYDQFSMVIHYAVVTPKVEEAGA